MKRTLYRDSESSLRFTPMSHGDTHRSSNHELGFEYQHKRGGHVHEKKKAMGGVNIATQAASPPILGRDAASRPPLFMSQDPSSRNSDNIPNLKKGGSAHRKRCR